MIAALKFWGVLLSLALTGFFAYRAGVDHATSRDETARLAAVSRAEAGAERQRKLDEAEQALLAQRLSNTEAAYEDLERTLPETELLQAPADCPVDALFNGEFVRLWNGGAADAAGAEQTY